MSGVLALGAVLVIVGMVLLLDLFGAGAFVIRHLTSRPLGRLAPGFAATRGGFRVYAALVISLGVACAAVGAATWSTPVAAGLLLAGGLLFVIASVMAISGEVATYRRER